MSGDDWFFWLVEHDASNAISPDRSAAAFNIGWKWFHFSKPDRPGRMEASAHSLQRKFTAWHTFIYFGCVEIIELPFLSLGYGRDRGPTKENRFLIYATCHSVAKVDLIVFASIQPNESHVRIDLLSEGGPILFAWELKRPPFVYWRPGMGWGCAITITPVASHWTNCFSRCNTPSLLVFLSPMPRLLCYSCKTRTFLCRPRSFVRSPKSDKTGIIVAGFLPNLFSERCKSVPNILRGK